MSRAGRVGRGSAEAGGARTEVGCRAAGAGPAGRVGRGSAEAGGARTEVGRENADVGRGSARVSRGNAEIARGSAGARRGRARFARDRRGQSLVEFALMLPLFLLLLLAMLDFGFAFYTNLTLEYASREGARVGAALAAGGSALPCGEVDDHVIAAVQRVLESAGISVRLNPADPAQGGVNWIRIYKADQYGGGYTSNYNQWTYAAHGGPTVDGTPLDFVGPSSPAWSACSRVNGATPDALGVAIDYTYTWKTPLGSVFGLVSSGSSFFSNLHMLDRTVMDLNPTYP